MSIYDLMEHISEGLCICEITDKLQNMRFNMWNQKMTDITGYIIEDIFL